MKDIPEEYKRDLDFKPQLMKFTMEELLFAASFAFNRMSAFQFGVMASLLDMEIKFTLNKKPDGE